MILQDSAVRTWGPDRYSSTMDPRPPHLILFFFCEYDPFVSKATKKLDTEGGTEPLDFIPCPSASL
jgi:hypothetical protein